MSATAFSPPIDDPQCSAAQPGPWWRRALRSEPALAVSAGLLALLAAAIVLRLWRARIGVPLGYGGDGLWTQQVVKGMVDRGWFLTNPDVGAPFGQELHDFTGALGDNLHFVVIKAMSVLSQDPVKLVNGYFLLGFFLCAASACLVLRTLGVSRGAAVVAAVLFSLLPAHVGGGLGRLTLGAYWSIPLAALLIMRVFAGEPLFARRSDGGRLTRWGSRRTLVTAGLCFVIAGSGLYYALFTVMLLVLAAVAVLLTRRDMRASLGGGLAALLVLAVFVAHIAPSILYAQRHGENQAFAQRPVLDSSAYATSLALLVSPVAAHRWKPAAEFAEELDAGKLPPGPNEHALSALGLIAALGFVGLLLVAVVPGARHARERAGPAAATALVAFLLGTSGGIGLLVALLITPDLRGWGRISPLLGFLGLFAAALAYDALRARTASAGSWRRYGVAALLPAALVVGVADQTTLNMVPSYEQLRREYRSDARFASAIETRLPAGAGVLQLPPAPFPEGGTIEQMSDYSLMRGPLHADTLRFSYGSVKGRPAGDWVGRLSRLRTVDALPYYVAAGFRGIWVDRRGYADRGAALDADLRGLLRQARPLPSEDDQLRFYSLVDYASKWSAGRTAQQLRMARDAALYPSNVNPAAGTSLQPDTGTPQVLDPARGGSLRFVNPGRLERTVLLRGRLQARGSDVTVVAELPGGRRARLRASSRARAFLLAVRVPGDGAVDVRLRAPGARSPLLLVEPQASDESVQPR